MILPPQLFYFLRNPGLCRGFAFFPCQFRRAAPHIVFCPDTLTAALYTVRPGWDAHPAKIRAINQTPRLGRDRCAGSGGDMP